MMGVKLRALKAGVQNKRPGKHFHYIRPHLYPKQLEAIFEPRDLLGATSRYALIEASTKTGKAQPLDAIVYGPHGPRAMGDLAVGDEVFAVDGSRTRVTGVFPRGVLDIYRVTFNDGSSTECTADHLWEVNESYAPPRVMTTADVAAAKPYALRRAWIEVASAPVDFDARPIPLDPYLVGALVGDGGMTQDTITFGSVDDEILDRIRGALSSHYELVHKGRCDYRIVQRTPYQFMRDDERVIVALRDLGLWGKYSYEKRVPDVYRYNSVAVRLEVLRGLMDTDGSVGTRYGEATFSSSSEQLAKDVAEIVESLGGSCRVSSRQIHANLDGERRRYRDHWLVRINHAEPSTLFHLGRKRALCQTKKRDVKRTFRLVELVRRAEARCISVDHPRELYLTDRFIATHNTTACIVWLFEAAFRGRKGQNFWWVAPVFGQALIAFKRMKAMLPPELYDSRESPPTITLPNGAVVWFKSAEDPDSLYGDDVFAAVLDEASRMREESMHAVRTTLTATQGPMRIIGNVKGRRNWFYGMCRKAEAGEPNMAYRKLTYLDAVEAGIFPASEADDARRLLPEKIFRELYLAEASDDAGNPFGLAAIAACVRPLSKKSVAAWGWDLAKSVDWTVGLALDEDGNQCRPLARFQKPWPETTAEIIRLTGRDPALVDSTGVGDPVLSQLQKEPLSNFEGYHFSLPSKQVLMEGLAVDIQGGAFGFEDGPLKLELEAFEYEYTRTGVRYCAPSGYHDDCVCAGALAAMHRKKNNGAAIWAKLGAMGRAGRR